MAIEVRIEDNIVDNFSGDAKNTLKTQVEKHAGDIINEANLIEQALREDGASKEITSNIVLQAVRKYRTNHSHRQNRALIITKIVSSLSLLVTGLLFDPAGYQNAIVKLIFFIIVLIVACVSTVLQFVFEDRE